MRPPKLQGIKTKAVPFIKSSVAWNGEGRWVESFVGSAVVALNVSLDRALLGDTNRHLIAFHRAVQGGTLCADSVRAFLEREGARLKREGESHYYRIRERFNTNHDSHDFLFLNRSCFNGLMRFNKKGGFNVPFCRKPERFRAAYITKICNQVRWVADRLRGRDWEFVCGDWTSVLRQVRQSDFVYADPSYAGRFTDYYGLFQILSG